jgi:adenine-specific DNA-methyltransferase
LSGVCIGMVLAPGYLNPVTTHVSPDLHTRPKSTSGELLCATDAAEAKRAFTPRIVVRSGEHAHRNLVFFGDNAHAMEQLERDGFAGAVDLVYIDPPFNTGRTFTGSAGQSGYCDSWPSNEAFLTFLRLRLKLVRSLMSERASFYLHIDRKVGHLVRVEIDEVIGWRYFRNELTRIKSNPKNSSRKTWGNQTDVIHFYSLPDAIWNDIREPLTEEQISRDYTKTDSETGRRYTTSPLYGDGEVKDGPTGTAWRGLMPPPGKHWARPPAELDELDRQGLIEWSSTGNPRRKVYADTSAGQRIQDVWDFKDKGGSRDSYPTEKNLEMLERIVQQSSVPGSIVLDCFMGSGTTLVSAAKHGRSFIGMDESPSSLAAAVDRLVDETGASFTVMAQTPIVSSDVALRFELSESKADCTVDVPQSPSRPRATAAMFAFRDGDGVWHADPLREKRGRFIGSAPELDHTHLLVFHADGAVVAAPLTEARATRRPNRPASAATPVQVPARQLVPA